MQTSASSSTACGDSSVNDLLHSPLLDSVPGNGLRHFHQLLDHLRHWYFDNLLDNLWYMDVCDLFTDLLRNSLPEVVANQAPLPCEKSIVKLTCPHDGQRSDDFFSEADLSQAHGDPLSRSWLVQVHRGTQEECTDAVVCRLKLDCGWVC